MRSPFGSRTSAVLSPCGLYRYRLSRVFPDGVGHCVFVMLNPSTADAEHDDRTVARCVDFARWWKFGRLEIVNLFALRSRNPAALLTAADPVGPANDRAIEDACRGAGRIVCAWGSHKAVVRRHGAVVSLLAQEDHFLKGRVFHLGLNLDRNPKHPLYVPKARTPELWYPR